MKQVSVSIAAALNPDPIIIAAGDIVVWTNNTAMVQTASSNDGGQTFTTGAIQPGANSLPITVPASTSYAVSPAGLQGNITVNNMALSFATDIKPMFTAMDQDHMLNQQGLFDLWLYDDVKANAQQILSAVKAGRMPPPASGEPRWSMDKVNTFQQWINDGFHP